MNKKEVLPHIQEYLKDKYQMVIATYGKHPWIATLYCAVDTDLNIYFLSNPSTLHCRQISTHPEVAVSFADAPQPTNSEKKGIQLYGIAKLLTENQEIIQALHLWRTILKVESDNYTFEGMMENKIEGRMYKITPKKIKYFNEEIWEEGEEPLIDL